MASSTGAALSLGLFLVALIIALVVNLSVKDDGSSNKHHDSDDNAKTWVVESIPVGDFDLELLPNELYTADALISLVNGAEKNIDISVMYWNLLATDGEDGFSQAELDAMGAQKGAELYQAFEDAAARGVKFRFLQDGVEEECPDELKNLLDKYPNTVSARFWEATDWYDGGIMHMKLWVVDSKHVYVGSANMDWLSLTQVKELGILTTDSHAVAADTQAYFDQWWKWASPSITPKLSAYFNPEFQATLTVPCFSTKLTSTTCKDPIAGVSSVVPGNSQAQASALLNGTSSQFFLSASPYEIAASPTSSKKGSIRTWDLDGLLYTIQDAKEFVYLSVMDFMPTAGYSGGYGNQPLWWSELVDALLVAATTKGIRVRMLTSYWAHTNVHEVPYLKPLQENAQVCRTGPYPPLCTGSLEIRLFEVPGWDSTGNGKDWPPYSRVNHAKYIVTDRRVNVGTSNMEWSYFYQTAGASLNTDHPLLRQGVQSVFERDWNSQYVYYLNGTAVNA